VDQLTYGEFIMSLPNPTSIHIFGMDPLEGKAILEINPTLIFSIVDKLFGGQGQPIETTRELTDIEASVLKKIILEALNDLTRVWENIITFSLTLEATQTNPQFVQIAAPNDTVILISFELKMPRSSGLVSIGYPFVVLEPIMSKISGQPYMTMFKRAHTQENRSIILRQLDLTAMPVIAELGRTTISVRDFIGLQRGDIIRLDRKVDENLVVTVGPNKKVLGRPGISGRKKAIEVMKLYQEGDD
jgi:flagellar motor switch protein FliM